MPFVEEHCRIDAAPYQDRPGLAECSDLDLANPLAGDTELDADLLMRIDRLHPRQ